MTGNDYDDFKKTVWQYYDQHGRHELPWRMPGEDGDFDPYRILVSEVMLQQTQVGRVIDKYRQFLERFPDVQALARAQLGEVLVLWQGLGYNRRAKYLWQAAQLVAGEYGGRFPRDQKELTKLPGVGMNTAGAIVAYAYDQPVVFIETNIRSVFIHHFFADQIGLADAAVAELVQATLPKANFRQWYWALMDYGTFIKQAHGNTARLSKAYAKQSPFDGSRRQVRGAVVRQLTLAVGQAVSGAELQAAINDPRLPEVLQALVAEGIVAESSYGGIDANTYRLA